MTRWAPFSVSFGRLRRNTCGAEVSGGGITEVSGGFGRRRDVAHARS